MPVSPSTGVPSNPCCLRPFFCRNRGVDETWPWLRFIARYHNKKPVEEGLVHPAGRIMPTLAPNVWLTGGQESTPESPYTVRNTVKKRGCGW